MDPLTDRQTDRDYYFIYIYMKVFEDDVFDMIRKIEFKLAKPVFPSKRNEDFKKVLTKGRTSVQYLLMSIRKS